MSSGNSPDLVSFLVTENEAGERLDSFLASRIEGWSRAKLQRLIDDADVLVNQKPAKASYRVQAEDEIEVELVISAGAIFTAEDIPLEIVYEDEVLVVVNKPAGMVVHPAAGVYSGTLANALAHHFEQLSGQAGAARPGVVHRLDKDTSGLMVVAKTDQAHEDLANQFRDRSVVKHYLALVHGVVAADRGSIDQPVGRDPANRTRMAVVSFGRSALSLYEVKRRFESFSLLDVQLKTGRTHQIRVHLAWLRHPVVGDETYGGGRDNTVRDPAIRAQIRKLGRHFLHAAELGFRHPATKKELRFTSPLPEELAGLLSNLD